MVVIAVLLVGWLRLNSFSDALVFGAAGPVTSPAGLPIGLKALTEEPLLLQLGNDQLKIHCLQSGWDSEHVCKISAQPLTAEAIVSQLQLSPQDIPTWSIFSGNRLLSGPQFPSWTIPIISNSRDYYASEAFMNRAPNDQYELLYDRDDQKLYIHHYYNF
jgi:hypothetical protein